MDLMPSARVMSVSMMVSADEKDGHYYWYYKRLANEFDHADFVSVVGPQPAIGDGDVWWRPVLSGPRLERFFGWRPMGLRIRDLHSISAAVKVASDATSLVVQFYDGGLDDLVMATFLATKFPTTAFLFNFRPGRYWVPLLSTNRPFSRQALGILRSMPSNVFLCSETTALSAEIEKKILRKLETYPLYSAQEFSSGLAFERRNIDVSFFPKTQDELELCVLIAAELRKVTACRTLVSAPHPILGAAREFLDRCFDEVHEGPLAAPLYRKIFGSSKIVLLPYVKEYFKYGSSGKFNDALLAGAIPLVPRGSAPAGQARDPNSHHHFEFIPTDVPGTAAQLSTLAQRVEGFSASEPGVTFRDFETFVYELADRVRKNEGTPSSLRSKLQWIAIVIYVDFVKVEAHWRLAAQDFQNLLFRQVRRSRLGASFIDSGFMQWVRSCWPLKTR